MKQQYKILLVLFLLPFLGFSNGDDFSYAKQRTINKTFQVNPDAGINIENSYGKIFVSTWDKDEIEIEVIIKVSGTNEKWVNQKLASIDVNFSALKSMITAKTILENSSNKGNGRNNNFEINYTIKIPKNGTAKLVNKYGNISTFDLFSTTDISCKYGQVNLGKLNGNNNTIQIGYCSNSTIEYLKNGSVISKYSDIKIDKLAKIDLISDYSEIEISEGTDVKYISKYGSVKIQKVGLLDANGNYLDMKVGSLSNQLKLYTKYSNVAIDAVEATANNITIVSGYTGVDIGFKPNYFFDFDITVKYADFEYGDELTLSSKEETNYTKRMSGFYKKKGVNKVAISSDYGNVRLHKSRN